MSWVFVQTNYFLIGILSHFSHKNYLHALGTFNICGQMQDESAPVSLSLFFVVLLIRKDFS